MNWFGIIALIYCILTGIYFTIHYVVWCVLKAKGWQAIATLNSTTLRLSNHRWIMPDGREMPDRSIWKALSIEMGHKA